MRAWGFCQKVRDLSERKTPALLKAAGVEYVIVHKGIYKEGPIPPPLRRYHPPSRAALAFGEAPAAISAGLRLHKVFGNDLVFVLP